MARPLGGYASLDEALPAVLSKSSADLGTERIIVTKALGRIAVREILAPGDIPDSHSSHMDGFAVLSEDLRSASPTRPVLLRIVGSLPPGSRFGRRLKTGEAVQIATGGFLPEGADAVVPVEEAISIESKVKLTSPTPPWRHVYRRADDVRRGEPLLAPGRPIRAQDVGMLLTTGFSRVEVWRRPKVALIATGSELTTASRPKAGEVRNSHSPVIQQLCTAVGCDVVDLGVVGDDSAATARLLRTAISISDLVFTLGGTSVGKHDLVGRTVSSLKPEVFVHGVKMDRGRVAGVAVIRKKPLVMLPGPIQGAMNAFLLMGMPVIDSLSHRSAPRLDLPCTLGEAWEARRRFTDFRKVLYVRVEGSHQKVAHPLLAETESFKVLTEADGYVVVPETVARLEQGSRVLVRVLPGFSTL